MISKLWYSVFSYVLHFIGNGAVPNSVVQNQETYFKSVLWIKLANLCSMAINTNYAICNYASVIFTHE